MAFEATMDAERTKGEEEFIRIVTVLFKAAADDPPSESIMDIIRAAYRAGFRDGWASGSRRAS